MAVCCAGEATARSISSTEQAANRSSERTTLSVSDCRIRAAMASHAPTHPSRVIRLLLETTQVEARAEVIVRLRTGQPHATFRKSFPIGPQHALQEGGSGLGCSDVQIDRWAVRHRVHDSSKTFRHSSADVSSGNAERYERLISLQSLTRCR
jgi:hypothetical protein